MRTTSSYRTFGRARFVLPLIASLTLSGCGALKFGFDPPGVSGPTFRKCLVERGFFPASAADLRDSDWASWKILGDQYDSTNIDALPVDKYVAFTAVRLRGGLVPPRLAPADPQQPNGRSADWPVNRYLDCYVDITGPKSMEGIATDAEKIQIRDADIEGRLLRGHMLLAALSRYGASLIASHSGGVKPARAAKLFQDIRAAELGLRSASPTMNSAGLKLTLTAERTVTVPDAASPPVLKWAAGTDRILRILQVAVDIQAIATDQAVDRIKSVVGMLSGGGVLDAKSILKDAVGGLLLAQKAESIGSAYGNDGLDGLAEHRAATIFSAGKFTYDQPTNEKIWKAWDAPLEEGCKALAVYGQLNAKGCRPTLKEMEDAVAELPAES